MTSGNAWKAGRVVIDDYGIAQRPLWGLFGEHFKLRWCDVVSWYVEETVRRDRSTGKNRIVERWLLFFHKDGSDRPRLYAIWRPGPDKQFPLIVDQVRHYLPDKEPEPPWLMCPGTPPYSGGWRQGGGEGWIKNVWFPFWNRLAPDEKDAYLMRYPPPDDDWNLYLTQYWR
jgi:hypothetical protein